MEYVRISTEQLQAWLHVALEEGKDGLDLFDAWAATALAEYGVEQAPVRPRVALIAITVATVLFLYSVFMVLLGVFLSRIFGKSGDAQIMQMIHQIERIHDDVLRTKDHLEQHRRNRAWWKSTLMLLVVPVEVAIAAVLYFYEADAILGNTPNTDYAQLALEASPLLIVPMLMFLLYKLFSYWHSSRIARNETKLKDLQKQHEELVKRYEEKIDAEQHKRVMSVIRDTRALFGDPKRQQQSQQQPQKRRPGTAAGTAVPVKGSSAARPVTPVQRPPQPQPPQQQRMPYPTNVSQPIRQSAPAARGGRGAASTGAASGEEAPAGKLISSAMGLLSGGSGTVELVCQACGYKCGTQPKEELPQFDCAQCGTFNDLRTAQKEVEKSETKEEPAESKGPGDDEQ